MVHAWVLVLVSMLVSASSSWAQQPKELAKRLHYFTDGKGHYVGADPKTGAYVLYYARGKEHFYAQHVVSISSPGDAGAYNKSFWAPNVVAVNPQSIHMRTNMHGEFGVKPDGRAFLRCGVRKTPMVRVEGKRLSELRKRKLRPLKHRREVYLFARDDAGRYYFVDKLLSIYGGEGYRLFVGPAGAMKRMRLDDVIVDEVGDVLQSPGGRLVRNKRAKHFAWHPKMSRAPVPVYRLSTTANSYLIYAVLGVYRGRLGTPCDDL